MKHVLTVVFVCFALSLCNLSERLHKGSSNSNSSGSSSSGGAAAERAQPTAAQTAALAGGKEAKWERQGMSWTVPPQWTEHENARRIRRSVTDRQHLANAREFSHRRQS